MRRIHEACRRFYCSFFEFCSAYVWPFYGRFVTCVTRQFKGILGWLFSVIIQLGAHIV